MGVIDPLIAPPDPIAAASIPPPPGERQYIPEELIPKGPEADIEEAMLEAAQAEAHALENPGEELSPEEEVMFSTLLTCGKRSKTVKILDHIVVVETVNGDDDLRIGLYAKPYVGTLGEQRAYQIAVAAAGLRSINGKPVVQTLYADADLTALFEEKVAIVAKMYPHVIQRMYRAVLDAEKEFAELVERLGKSNG